MGPSKLRKAIGAVKDKTSISLAKVNNNALSDLDVAIVKATRHDEYPAEERHVREIINLTGYSRPYVSACVSTISRRLSKTKNWVVALKSLMLIQRLLIDGDPSYQQEIFFATKRGTRLLNMSEFRDTSRYDSWDNSAFVRTYALYLDEHLEFRMQNRRGKRSTFSYEEDEEEVASNAIVVRTTPVRDMRNEQILSRVHHLMHLLERFLACRPTGLAKTNRIVITALYPIMKESFHLYHDITEILSILIDRFMGMDVADSVKVHDIMCRVSKQYDELDMYYNWAKTMGIARPSEYPDVEKIPHKKLDVMEDFIREKSDMTQNRRLRIENVPNPEKNNPEPEPKPEPEPEPEHEPELEDMNSIKALPPPEGFQEEVEEEKEKVEEKQKTQENTGDLMNLCEDAQTTEEHGNKLALALFDGNLTSQGNATSTISPWEAFINDSGDWETALIQSASHLSNQKPNLPGGMDPLVLDGMYQQGATNQAVASSGLIATGSASSVAFGSAGRPALLALPPPPGAEGGATTSTSVSSSSSSLSDPFAASLSVAPPSYVQMSEMDKKQRLLMEEQIMWQQYAKDGMQGQVGLQKIQQNQYPYNKDGYMRTY